MPCCWSSIRLLTWWSDSESEPPPLWLLPEYGAPASSPKLRILRLFLFWSVWSRGGLLVVDTALWSVITPGHTTVALCLTPLNTLSSGLRPAGSYRWLLPPSRHQHLPPPPIPASHWSSEQRGPGIGRQARVWPAGTGQILVGIIKTSSAATGFLSAATTVETWMKSNWAWWWWWRWWWCWPNEDNKQLHT